MKVVWLQSSPITESKPPADLESIFFDLEVDMENNITRDMICTDREHERRKLLFDAGANPHNSTSSND
jgi:hypothetical protein